MDNKEGIRGRKALTLRALVHCMFKVNGIVWIEDKEKKKRRGFGQPVRLFVNPLE